MKARCAQKCTPSRSRPPPSPSPLPQMRQTRPHHHHLKQDTNVSDVSASPTATTVTSMTHENVVDALKSTSQRHPKRVEKERRAWVPQVSNEKLFYFHYFLLIFIP